MLIFVFLTNKHIKNIEVGDTEKVEQTLGESVTETGTKVGNSIKKTAAETWKGFKEVFGIKSGVEKEKAQLEEIKKMKEEDLITEEEYEAKRKQILKID